MLAASYEFCHLYQHGLSDPTQVSCQHASRGDSLHEMQRLGLLRRLHCST